MCEESIVKNCAPTLAGLKTGSIFNCGYDEKSQLFAELKLLNNRLRSKGLRIIPLRFHGGNALLYLFRPRKLSLDLSDKNAEILLKKCGYCVGDCNKCVAHLTERVRADRSFPMRSDCFSAIRLRMYTVLSRIPGGVNLPDCGKCTVMRLLQKRNSINLESALMFTAGTIKTDASLKNFVL